MNWFKRGDLLDRTFAVGIILKGLDGVLDLSVSSASPRRSVSSQKRSIRGQGCCWATIPRRSATWPWSPPR